MNNRNQVRIQHIVDSCKAIQEFIQNKKRHDLDSNRMLLSAIIRELEIIGEAVNSLSEDFKSQYKNIPYKDMIGMRNRLIHAYFDVNLDVVWKTITVDIPIILTEFKKISESLH